MSRPLNLLLIAGARPNFMKVAPLIHAIQRHNQQVEASSIQHPASSIHSPISFKLLHTGQHYDEKMSEVFFRELGIPAPDFNLEVGSGSHSVQTARIMERFEPVLLNAFSDTYPLPSSGPQSAIPHDSALRTPPSAIPPPPSALDPRRSTLDPPSSDGPGRPDWVVVVGDVNSTLACTLVAAKLGVKVAHVEAGLRSFDRTMPEEINRIVTDSLADLLLTPSEDANENLRRESIPEHRIKLVGNIMIDALIDNLEKARQSTILDRLGLKPGQFAYVTLHRPGNVDDASHLRPIMTELQRLARQMPVVFPLHPRTKKMLSEFGLPVNGAAGLNLLNPIGYHDSLCLTENARLVLTDSGGLQEESTFFQTPCLTLRPNTERPVTLTLGSNRLTCLERLSSDINDVLAKPARLGQVPQFWDGGTAGRALQAVIEASRA
jgi:UDP-N-acetylglucosamine 2-epimerase (non-hydrolysing)